MSWVRDKLGSSSEHIACIEAGHHCSYAELQQRIDALCARLTDCPRQSVIAIQSTQTIDGIAALLAIAELELIALPLGAQLTPTDSETYKAIAAADYHLRIDEVDSALVSQTAGPRPALYQHLLGSGLILFSSGTSGTPKAMLHDLNALLARFKSVRPRTDRSVQLLLLDHIGGFDSAFRTLFAGSTLIIPDERSPEALGRALEKHRATVLPASPTFLNLLLLEGIPNRYDCSSVKIIAYGAEAMPAPLLKRLAAAFPQAELQQKFGTSETGAIRIRSRHPESLFFSIQDLDTEWKVIDDELWLRTPSRILGYLNADNATLESDGWYRTGDLVETDSEGHLRIVGRKTALINIGGQKVHPGEIEAVLHPMPEVDACHVFAKSDPILGNVVACEITTRSSDDMRTWKRRIRSHCRGRLAAWKIPTQVHIKAHLGLTDRLKRA